MTNETIPDILLPDVSVLIVNYNGGDYIKGCLASLERQTYRNFEVILVDNASADGSADDLTASPGRRFELIRSPENLGFARGNNLAARSAKGRWLALLNPDAEAAPDWIERLLALETAFPQTTMFASAQIDLHDRARLDGVGDNYLGWGIPWRGGFGRRVEDMPGAGRCFSPCGAGAFFRADVFRAADGFDERYFCFCEDVDLGFRLRLGGHESRFDPDLVIRHAGGGLSGRASEFSVYHGARNRIWTYAKCMPLPWLILTLPGHIALTLAILFRGLFNGRFGPTWRGVWHGVRGIGPFLKERKRWHSGARKQTATGIMAWNPFDLFGFKPFVRSSDPNERPVRQESSGREGV